MDRISRLLSLSTAFTPCIAIAFHNEQLHIAVNTPKNQYTQEAVQQILEKKFSRLTGFLLSVKAIYMDNPLDVAPNDISEGELTFLISTKAMYLMTRLALSLTSDELGRTGVANSEKYSVTERLSVDLKKMAIFYLKGLISQGRIGFRLEEIQALEKGKTNVYFPDLALENEQKGTLHADQLMLKIIMNSMKKKALNRPILQR